MAESGETSRYEKQYTKHIAPETNGLAPDLVLINHIVKRVIGSIVRQLDGVTTPSQGGGTRVGGERAEEPY